MRTDGANDCVFLMNFNNKKETIVLGNKFYTDLISEQEVDGKIELGAFDIRILKRQNKNSEHLY